MSKCKMCCFTVNVTHACIIANNYINSNLENVKVSLLTYEGDVTA